LGGELLSTQGDKLKAVADAIRAKEGSSAPIAANDFPARIAAIETGTQLPTLTNPGTAADMARGKQLIDQNGEIVTGTLRESTAGSGYTVIDTTPTLNSTNLQLDYTFEMDRIMRKDSILNMMCPISNFGNATAADVLFGKTFTSEAGVKVSGTGQFFKILASEITGSGSNQIRATYAGTGFPIAVMVYLSNGAPYEEGSTFMLSIVGTGSALCGNDYMITSEIEYLTASSSTPSNSSVVLGMTQTGILDIFVPYQRTSGTRCKFEQGRPYQVLLFYV
jgi:hypothetical protein